MALREIIKKGDPVLEKHCHPVTRFDQKLWDLLDDMRETLAQANGLGLAAPPAASGEGVGRVGVVFQEDRLCPQLTPEENVALVLPVEQYKAKTQYKEQIRRDLIQLGLDDEAFALPARKLSGGQKRRTALLRALWAESDTLLLDEPFTGMDPAAMKKAAAMLKARCGAKPALLATHDQAAIRELGWRVIELG